MSVEEFMNHLTIRVHQTVRFVEYVKLVSKQISCMIYEYYFRICIMILKKLFEKKDLCETLKSQCLFKEFSPFSNYFRILKKYSVFKIIDAAGLYLGKHFFL